MAIDRSGSERALTGVLVPPDALTPRVVIVGGGFCGVVLAAELLRAARHPLQVTVLEPNHPLGCGVAYNTRDPAHLLNVPAASMSACADDPDHFVRWLERHAHRFGLDAERFATVYAPRLLYGRYLQDTLMVAAEQAQPGVTLVSVDAEALGVGAVAHGLFVGLSNQQTLNADAVVLAVGNLPPRALPGTAGVGCGVVQDPWSDAALAGLAPDAALLAVGTGLSTVDLVASLHARGHRGLIYALSRRGVLPRPHLPPAVTGSGGVALPTDLARRPAASLPELTHRVRDAARAHPGPWQEVVDSLRATTPALWRGLSSRDKRRYLVHLRPYWDAHRSRVAPQIAGVLSQMQASGQLVVLAGQLLTLTRAADELEATLKLRGGGSRSLRVVRVVNATGPETDLTRTSHPLLRALLHADWVRPEATGLGLEVDPTGRVKGAQTRPLYALGALRRNESYEGIAVPELRRQAHDLASTLLTQLEPTNQAAASR